MSQLTATSISLTFRTNTFLNESDHSVSLDTPNHSFPKEYYLDKKSFCREPRDELRDAYPNWSLVVGRNSESEFLDICCNHLPTWIAPRNVSHRVRICNREPIIVSRVLCTSVYHVHKLINIYSWTISSESSTLITHLSPQILEELFLYVFLFRLWMSRFVWLLSWRCCRSSGRSPVRVGFGTFSSLSFRNRTWEFRSVFQVLGSQMYSCLSEILWRYGRCYSLGYWECVKILKF